MTLLYYSWIYQYSSITLRSTFAQLIVNWSCHSATSLMYRGFILVRLFIHEPDDSHCVCIPMSTGSYRMDGKVSHLNYVL